MLAERIERDREQEIRWKGALLDIRNMVQQLGNFEEAPEGAHGSDFERSDPAWRRHVKRHAALKARMAQDARSRRN
jgi:hypothetical protein